MGARTIIDGAGVTNHFTASFPPFVSEANFISITGLGDDTEVIDGPDGRGYSTGKKTKRELTVIIAEHEPAVKDLMNWKEAVENGSNPHHATGTVNRLNSRDEPVGIWELERCMCKMVEANDMSLDGGDVGQLTFTITYYQAKLVGP